MIFSYTPVFLYAIGKELSHIIRANNSERKNHIETDFMGSHSQRE